MADSAERGLSVLLDRQLEELEARIQDKLRPYQAQYELLQTIPGVKEITAASILAEIGPDMSQFPSAKQLCSWARICPGNNRSAGKSKHSRIKKGNKFLMATLVQAGWAAARERDSVFQMRKLGEPKANVAIARNLLAVTYAMLKERRPFREPNPGQMHDLEKAKLVRHHAKRLRQLGADEALVKEMLAQMSYVDETPFVEDEAPFVEEDELSPLPAPQRIRKFSPAKVCRGVLGFRARQTRKQEYSVFNRRRPGGPPPSMKIAG